MMERPLFNHVDIRVRDRQRALAFYDRLLGAMGLDRQPAGETFQTYGKLAEDGYLKQWLGFTVQADMTPGDTRVCFAADSRSEVDRLAGVARSAGALHFESAHEAYGPNYYATFFEDPDGNRLEIAYISG